MAPKTYALMNFSTKATAEIVSTSYEAAVKEFTGVEILRPSRTVSGIRLYSVGGHSIGATVAA